MYGPSFDCKVYAMLPFHGRGKTTVSGGFKTLSERGVVVDEEHVQRGGPLTVWNAGEGGDNIPTLCPQDFEELWPTAPTHFLGEAAPYGRGVCRTLLGEDKTKGLDTMEQKWGYGLGVREHHGAPHYDMGNLLDLV